jgi:hypothetical protein
MQKLTGLRTTWVALLSPVSSVRDVSLLSDIFGSFCIERISGRQMIGLDNAFDYTYLLRSFIGNVLPY